MFLKRFILIVTVVFSHAAFASWVDGTYTLSGVQNNNVQLHCTCGSASFIESPMQSDTAVVFSDAGLGTGIAAAGCKENADHSYDLPTCQFQSTDTTPIVYATVSILSEGYHCMGSGAPSGTCTAPGWAFAANWVVTPVSQTADYMVSSAPTANQPLPCAGGCTSGPIYNQWTGQLYKTIAGSVVVTNGPADLQVACSQPAVKNTRVKTDPPASLTIDLQATHDQFAQAKPDQSVTALCQLTSAGKSFGSLTLQDINGIRPSTKTPPAHIWSTAVSIATQPDPSTDMELNQPSFTTSSDTSGNYHNLWTVAFQQAVYSGTVTITGAPIVLTSVECTLPTSVHLQRSQDDPNTLTLDLETIGNHKLNTCELVGNGLSFGKLAFADLAQYQSQAHPGSKVWAAQVTVNQEPSGSTGYTLSAPVVAQGSDSDPTAQYHNLWTTTLTKNSNNKKRS